MAKQTVRVAFAPPRASGGRRGWAKHLAEVDATRTNGYAFLGRFLDRGESDLPIGDVVVLQAPGGSVKNWSREWRLGIVAPSGRLLFEPRPTDGQTQFLTFRDRGAAWLADRVAAVAALRAGCALTDSWGDLAPAAPDDPSVAADLDDLETRFAAAVQEAAGTAATDEERYAEILEVFRHQLPELAEFADLLLRRADPRAEADRLRRLGDGER